MNFIVDTHLLIWSAIKSPKLSKKASDVLLDRQNNLIVSVVSLWEIALKRSMNRDSFRYEVGPFRAGLLANGYEELALEGRHLVTFSGLPKHHTDPFDRILVSQAQAESMTLLSADLELAAYGELVLVV